MPPACGTSETAEFRMLLEQCTLPARAIVLKTAARYRRVGGFEIGRGQISVALEVHTVANCGPLMTQADPMRRRDGKRHILRDRVLPGGLGHAQIRTK
jgi:hypothetical protein